MALCSSDLLSLCEHCAHLPLSKLPDPLGVFSYEHHHLPNARDLTTSAEKCQLCTLFLRVLVEGIQEVAPGLLGTTPLEDLLHQQPLVLKCEMDSAGRNMPDGPRLTGLTIVPPLISQELSSDLYCRLDLDLFADQDSTAAASGVIGARRPLDGHDSDYAFDLLNEWLHECLNAHPSCKLNVAGVDVDESQRHEFPTRLIDVGDPAERSTAVCLRETCRLNPPCPYVALSHCWGAPETMTLRTTTDNVQRHMEDIPWDQIPQTFKDAIQICRKVGIRYLWIDSLAIIQDDIQDWERESVYMGSIYSRARLTIAASHAKDSREGCFRDRPVLAAPVKIPFWVQDPVNEKDHGDTAAGRAHGSVYIQQRPWKDLYGVHEQHLDTRAWITQEMILSRRRVFYTKARVVWKCAERGEDETGRHARVGYGRRDWVDVVSEYSARQLTRETDRLAALQGLASELATTRPGDTYSWGIWRGELPQQLLWHRQGPMRKAPTALRIPSWSWASGIGAIKPSPFSRIRLAPETSTPDIRPIFHCKLLGVEPDGHMILEGVIIPLPPVQSVGYSFSDKGLYLKGGGHSTSSGPTPISELRPEWCVDCIKRFMATGFVPAWLILHPDHPNVVLGMVSFDYDPDPDPDDPTTSTISMICFRVLNGMRHDSWSAEYFLLLRPHGDEEEGNFTRAGMGIFFSSLGDASYLSGQEARVVRIL